MFYKHTFRKGVVLCVDHLGGGVCADQGQGDGGGGHWVHDDNLDCGARHASQACVGSSEEYQIFF